MSQIINANEEYERARKRGLKEFTLRRARGESGLLPVIHAKREENGVLAVVDQPMRPISLNRIAGTYQASRANGMDLAAWKGLFADCGREGLASIHADLGQTIADELAYV